MRAKSRLLMAGLAAFILGVPLAERVEASSSADVVFTSIEAALAITFAAIEAS